MKELNVAVIGVGNIGSAHAAALYGGMVEGARLAALCDTDEGKRATLSEKYKGVPVYADADGLFSAGICDAVIVSVPHRHHAPIGIKAFESGLHVLCEKPIGVSVSDAKALISAAEKSGKVFSMMFNQRTNPVFRKVKELVDSGAVGQIKRAVWVITNWYRSQAYYNSGGWRATWSGEGGGVLLNQAPHQLDLFQWICGMPSKVRGFCYEGKYHDIEVEDDATLYFEYEGGAVGTFITSTGEWPGTNRLEISGDMGKLTVEDGRIRLWRLPESERKICFETSEGFPEVFCEYSEPQITGIDGGHRAIIQNFTNACLHGEELIAPGIDGIRQISLSNAAYLSAWTDETVSLPLDSELFDSLLSEKAKVSSFHESKNEALRDGYNPRWQVQW